MKLTRFIETIFRYYLPSPFTIAVGMTLLTFALALLFTDNPGENPYFFTLLRAWERGIWNNDMLVFAYQMMLILVLGHVLVLSKPVENIILKLVDHVKSPAGAALWVALPTMLVSFFNWGLGLIFGAILARKMGEHAHKGNIPINYPLIGACGYLGLMVWHGGISGSAPIKVAEKGHLRTLMQGVWSEDQLERLPEYLPTAETVLSMPNLILFIIVVVLISLTCYYLGKTTEAKQEDCGNPSRFAIDLPNQDYVEGKNFGERLNHSNKLGFLFGSLILFAFAVQYTGMLMHWNITPNLLNFLMLGLAILMHGNFNNFLVAVERAIGDTSGILIQFPLYFGIMGIMAGSGMIQTISDAAIAITNENTIVIGTFFSAALVNVFVPSGGGQWAIQGPMIIESAMALQVPLGKMVLALSYGDQITNMMQPFWALPLLAITKLKAKQILPYTLIFMFLGGSVYLIGLLLF